MLVLGRNPEAFYPQKHTNHTEQYTLFFFFFFFFFFIIIDGSPRMRILGKVREVVDHQLQFFFLGDHHLPLRLLFTGSRSLQMAWASHLPG